MQVQGWTREAGNEITKIREYQVRVRVMMQAKEYASLLWTTGQARQEMVTLDCVRQAMATCNISPNDLYPPIVFDA